MARLMSGDPPRGGRVFISYRREGGSTLARLVKENLERRGYKVFLDREGLSHGPFNTALLREIDSSTDVAVILTPNSLDRCRNEDDWLRLEVAYSMRQGKNVVPVMDDGFTWPTGPLPDVLAEFPLFEGAPVSHDFFDASMTRLAALLVAQPSRWRILLRSPAVLIAESSLLLVVLIVLVLIIRKPPGTGAPGIVHPPDGVPSGTVAAQEQAAPSPARPSEPAADSQPVPSGTKTAPAPPPKDEVREDMVLIPAGRFVAGLDMADVPEPLRPIEGVEKLTQGGRRDVFLPAFSIDKYEVSNAEYARFVRATGWAPPSHWKDSSPPADTAEHPVVNVTYSDAEAYARWAGKRLPTADEWEKAARGTDARVYPWGADFAAGLCNTLEAGLGDTSPRNQFPSDKSPYGVIGMAGNVAEWTSSTERDETGLDCRVICGGSWLESGFIVSIASFRRTTSGQDMMRVDLGFRCAK